MGGVYRVEAKDLKPPSKLLGLAPYGDTVSHLTHPSPARETKALEISQNKEKTDGRRAHEEWEQQDENGRRLSRKRR